MKPLPDLDEDLVCSLEEPIPDASPLSETAFLRHSRSSLQSRRLLWLRESRFLSASQKLYKILSVLISIMIIVLLLWGVTDLPIFGLDTNPAENEVSLRYLEKGLSEGGATNLVSNMILDYRAFDTLGESNVLFTAVCAVMLLLYRPSSRLPVPSTTPASEGENAPSDPILRAGGKCLFPVILLLGAYIILNGHLGPGGGFSGGAIMGAGLILYRNAFGPRRAGQFFSYQTFRWVSFAALAFYALSKAYSFFTGANHLSSLISNGTPGAILSAGLILPLNIAVGLVVCGTMYGFFSLFERGDF